eukprot:Filipodium_phascolosomae@DN1189_c0_g1_i1.p1
MKLSVEYWAKGLLGDLPNACPISTQLTDFDIVHCYRIVPPDVAIYLSHSAIAYALSLMVSTIFEFIVWGCGKSLIAEIFVVVVAISLFSVLVVITITGHLAAFVSQWVQYVMVISIPVLLVFGARAGRALRLVVRHRHLVHKQRVLTSAMNAEFITPIPSSNQGFPETSETVSREGMEDHEYSQNVDGTERPSDTSSSLQIEEEEQRAIDKILSQLNDLRLMKSTPPPHGWNSIHSGTMMLGRPLDNRNGRFRKQFTNRP